MFALENSRTRHSLRSAFENIFEKYGREFAEDDEVDLLNLQVTMAGGHLARIKRMEFGKVFRGKQNRGAVSSTRHRLPSDDDQDYDEVEDVFENCKDAKRPSKVSIIQSSFVRAVAVRKKGGGGGGGGGGGRGRGGARPRVLPTFPSRIITPLAADHSFDQILGDIVKSEHAALKRAVDLRSHDCTGCFECILATSMIQNKS